MSLIVTGVNHRSASVDLRERLAFREDILPRSLMALRKHLDGAGVVILSTCNRVEIYAHHTVMSPEELCREVRGFLSKWHGLDPEIFREALYSFKEEEAVRHLFQVTASLDSLVVGEVQIVGQVHDAYLMAQTEEVADKIIHTLFQRAFTVAKTVRNETTIGAGEVSVSSAAVGLAMSIFSDLSDKRVMVVGSGEMSELTLKSFVSRGVTDVLILNRSPERAQALAEPYGGEAVAFDALEEHLHRADIVVSSTGAPVSVLHPEQFETAMSLRGGAPMFVIDIAVPRDVEPAVADVENVYLYNMDDLQSVAEENLAQRRKETDHCMALVEKKVDHFTHWMRGLAAEPTLVSLQKEMDAIRERELEKTLDALPDLTEKQREEVAYLSRRIVNNILQSPMSHVKQELSHHDPQTVLHLVKKFFGLKE